MQTATTDNRTAARRALAMGIAGAVIIAFSAIFVRLAHATPVTVAVFRCAYALPALALLVALERRRGNRLAHRELLLATAAGAAFACDLVLWHESIAAVGAGLATVLANVQVAIVGLVAWALHGERPARRQLAAIPVVLFGVVMIAGVAGGHAYGRDPVTGAVTGVLTAFAYTAFLLCLRAATPRAKAPVMPLAVATAVATVLDALYGVATGTLDIVPHWPGHGWLVLLALSCQVLAWLLIAVSLARLRAIVVSIVLTIQPVGSMLLGALLLGEHPGAVQLAGVLLVIAGIVVASSHGADAREASI